MAEIFDFYVEDNRTIKFKLSEPIMLEDNGVSEWRFHIPNIVNGLDATGWAWWLVYVNAKNEKYTIPLTLEYDFDRPDAYSIATYTVDYGMSCKAGTITFSIEAIDAEVGGEILHEWHTRTYSSVKVENTLQGNQVEYAETESDIISALLIEVQNKINQLTGGATPEVKDSISDMVDTKKVYILSTDKNWYYYNGSTWVPGGLYGIGDPETVVDAVNDWLDEHPEATTTVQDGSITEAKLAAALKPKVLKDYVTPEMYGAVGDGVTDDTNAVQSAFDSGYIVCLTKKYAVSQTLVISKDTVVICGSKTEILPLSNIDTLIAVGTGTVTTDNPLLNGLIKVVWHGGKINCKNGNYTASVGLELGKLIHSKFADISVINVSDTGIKYSGTYGALAICENVAVRGVSGTLAQIGFDLRRNDQRLYNCTAIDCRVGFYIRSSYNRLTGCSAWVTHSNNWTSTMAYVIDADDCGLLECTCDTVYRGVLFSSKAKKCTITNLFWLCNTGVVSDYSNMRLFEGSDGTNYVSVCCVVSGLHAQAYTKPVYLQLYIADDGNFSIFGLSTPDKQYITGSDKVLDPQRLGVIGDVYSANMAASPTTANSKLTESITLPAGSYVVTVTLPYITAISPGDTASCRIKANGASVNNIYHFIGKGWNVGFTEILTVATESIVYIDCADVVTHQSNSGSGIKAIRIK